MEVNSAHPLHGYIPPQQRLSSRKNFLRTSEKFTVSPEKARLELWKKMTAHLHGWMPEAEELPPGHNENWLVWKALNRLLSGVGRSRDNLKRWGFKTEDTSRDCGVQQTTSHMLQCPLVPTSCTKTNLLQATPNALEVAKYWAHVI